MFHWLWLNIRDIIGVNNIPVFKQRMCKKKSCLNLDEIEMWISINGIFNILVTNLLFLSLYESLHNWNINRVKATVTCNVFVLHVILLCCLLKNLPFCLLNPKLWRVSSK